jgi:hypothetical protein
MLSLESRNGRSAPFRRGFSPPSTHLVVQRVRRVRQQVAMLVHRAALGGHCGPQCRKCLLKAGRAVGDQELRRAQAAGDQSSSTACQAASLSPAMFRIDSSTFCPSRRTPSTTSNDRLVALRSSRTCTRPRRPGSAARRPRRPGRACSRPPGPNTLGRRQDAADAYLYEGWIRVPYWIMASAVRNGAALRGTHRSRCRPRARHRSVLRLRCLAHAGDASAWCRCGFRSSRRSAVPC